MKPKNLIMDWPDISKTTRKKRCKDCGEFFIVGEGGICGNYSTCTKCREKRV